MSNCPELIERLELLLHYIEVHIPNSGPFQSTLNDTLDRIEALEAELRDRDKAISKLTMLEERDAFYEGMRKDMSNKQKRIEALEGAAKADAERLQDAANRAGVEYFGCDTPEHLADRIEALEAALKEAIEWDWMTAREDIPNEVALQIEYALKPPEGLE
jgi:hypothetical protein